MEDKAIYNVPDRIAKLLTNRAFKFTGIRSLQIRMLGENIDSKDIIVNIDWKEA